MTIRRLIGFLAAAAITAATGKVLFTTLHSVAVSEVVEDVLPLPPEPPRLMDDPDYVRCLGQLRIDAQGARTFAEVWEATGQGGEGATHCRALALLALGEPEQAAAHLEALANRSASTAAAQSALYGQAGQAWMAAGQPARAHAAISQALSLTPSDTELLMDRAVTSGFLGRFGEALLDTSHATELEPARTEAWVFRATALRHLDRAQEAMRDVERALALDSANPEALLERGILRHLSGDITGARIDWERAVMISPDSATADLAQQNLALSEAGPLGR